MGTRKISAGQLFNNLYGMNNINDLYTTKRKGYRK